MKNILKNRKALSTVVTTLIILVVSVLLAGVVTYFAINVTSTRVQEESLNLMYQHVWYNTDPATGTGIAEAAVMVVNTGGRDVVLQKIAIRGQTTLFSSGDVYYSTTAATTDLVYLPIATLGLAPYTHITTDTPLVLKSGSTVVVYVRSPDSVSVNDVGLTIAKIGIAHV